MSNEQLFTLMVAVIYAADHHKYDSSGTNAGAIQAAMNGASDILNAMRQHAADGLNRK